MNIENLTPGAVYKNYKELCAALGIEPKAGSSKKKQLKEISKHVKFHRDGIKYVIEEISEKPMIPTKVSSEPNFKKKTHKRGMYSKHCGRKKESGSPHYIYYTIPLVLDYIYYESETPGTISDTQSFFCHITGLDSLSHEAYSKLQYKIQSIKSYTYQVMIQKKYVYCVNEKDSSRNSRLCVSEEWNKPNVLTPEQKELYKTELKNSLFKYLERKEGKQFDNDY